MPKVASNWNVQVARISHLVRALAKTVGKQGSIPVQERLVQSEHLTIKDDSTRLVNSCLRIHENLIQYV